MVSIGEPRSIRHLVPVVLAGGIGSRLWPLSRADHPKQFHTLGGTYSLLQSALLRAAAVTNCPPVVVTNEAHRFLVAEQCRVAGINDPYIALEPTGRGTAAAIALGAQLARNRYRDPLVLVLPTDHLIEDADGFALGVRSATLHAAADEGALVAFGIPPRYAETAYGYIEVEPSEEEPDAEGIADSKFAAAQAALPVRRFVEKPDAETARSYVASGRFLWNSGMFLFDARACLEAITSFRPDLACIVAAATAEGRRDGDFFRPGSAYADAPSGSFDVLVMERTARALVIPAAFEFTDIGSWGAVLDAASTDEAGNLLVGDVHARDVGTSLIHADAGLVAAIGIRDLAVVVTADAVLVAHRGRLQEVREVVKWLKASGRAEYNARRESHRPWGRFETVVEGDHYHIKRLTLKPGAAISLQRHERRSEHWVVLRGIAEVSCGDETIALRQNESACVPRSTAHRLRNPGDELLEILVVQIGEHLNEEDIVRLEDNYCRSSSPAAPVSAAQ